MNPGNKEKYLLDTSACLTFLENEEGAEEVEGILKNGQVILPFIVLLEIYYITLREKGQEVADKRYAMLKSLDVNFLWEIDEPTLILAGRFKAQYKISLADAIIASVAKRQDAILVHKDPEYQALGQETRQLILPYKKRPA